MKKMLKNNKGFTLVELLAVIVVLAVIMVIATQQVNGAIQNSRSNAFIDSYAMVVKQGKMCASQDIDPGSADCNYDLSSDYVSNPVTCSGDTCNVSLEASNDGKFKNMDLTKYGNAKSNSGCDATKIGSGADSCTAKKIEGSFNY